MFPQPAKGTEISKDCIRGKLMKQPYLVKAAAMVIPWYFSTGTQQKSCLCWFLPCLLPLLTNFYVYYRIIEQSGLEQTLKDPTSSSSARSVCSKPHPIWPLTLPGMCHPQLLWEACSIVSFPFEIAENQTQKKKRKMKKQKKAERQIEDIRKLRKL